VGGGGGVGGVGGVVGGVWGGGRGGGWGGGVVGCERRDYFATLARVPPAVRV